jgi:hypothetical protein
MQGKREIVGEEGSCGADADLGLLVPEPVQEGGTVCSKRDWIRSSLGWWSVRSFEIVCGLKGLFDICSNAWGEVLQGKITLENRKNDGRMPF